ncbi:RimJ/RimL family protein N-acetyltransferase [Bacillus mesophilus]|uniref:GNAT family N-acetyltransferase n=1 Tax=Bacillus mesophilus TaxID=1808955 RepID=A0A6M0QCA5_9BACI|nr:GNAT family N-acetyltransferase [Bacillus mesophilus]MBM7663235.1 RimJ/RimL family protein N-acetyltransferase [Bacillus mesophilus]NEY73926.1 GNAT family N-acetyltransferase [Bacillus mesophilus]
MIPTLISDRLVLRPFSLEDSPTVEELASSPLIADTTLNIPHPYPKGGAEAWIQSHDELAAAKNSFTFAIEKKETSELIGSMAIGIGNDNRAELAYWIGVPYWGHGYATEASKLLIRFGFEQKGLNKIWAAAFTRNPASTKVMEKVGMTYEGTFRQHVIKNGKYEDLSYCSILKEEYTELLKKEISSTSQS